MVGIQRQVGLSHLPQVAAGFLRGRQGGKNPGLVTSRLGYLRSCFAAPVRCQVNQEGSSYIEDEITLQNSRRTAGFSAV